jgi:hypothetical protein
MDVKPNVCNPIVDEEGNKFKSISELSRKLNVWAGGISKSFTAKGYYEHDGKKYFLMPEADDDQSAPNVIVVEKPREDEEEYQNYLKQKEQISEVENTPFETYDFSFGKKEEGEKYAVALFSDAHIEETVNPQSVMGLNEYNIDIAKQRIQNYFNNLAICLRKDEVGYLIFASLGDTISGYIHEELAQTNSLSPLEATLVAQSLIFGGLKYICETTDVKNIYFVGIVGNHSRVTKKIQHSNGYKMSYEWLMYQNIKRECEHEGLPIRFCLPESEMAIVNTEHDNKRFIFIHGFQIRSTGSGTVCGIYPALNRLSMKWDKIFHQDRIYLGHFHTCVSIPNAMVNGSIIGYNSFALSNGFGYERPAQQYEVYDTKIGLLLTRQIYCD